MAIWPSWCRACGSFPGSGPDRLVLERRPVVAGPVGALALAVVSVAAPAHVHDDRAVAAAVAHLEPDVAPAAVLREVAAGVPRPLDRAVAVLVLEGRVVVAHVVGAALVAVVAVAPAAYVHDHPAAVVVAVADVGADVAPAAVVGDLVAGVARAVELAAADAVVVAGLGGLHAGDPGRAQADRGGTRGTGE